MLFLGAYHEVASRLPADISVRMVKDPARVRLYLDQLFLGHDGARFKELAHNLTLAVLLFAFNLLGDAVNDAFNPRAR